MIVFDLHRVPSWGWAEGGEGGFDAQVHQE
jgi:hypothetical protein